MFAFSSHFAIYCFVTLYLSPSVFFFFSSLTRHVFPIVIILVHLLSMGLLKNSSKRREITRKFPLITLLPAFQLMRTKLQIHKNAKQKQKKFVKCFCGYFFYCTHCVVALLSSFNHVFSFTRKIHDF